MAYEKTVWSNGATALSETNMNHIEQGIYDAHEFIDGLIDMIYPIGSIFMSVSPANPGTYITGTTWTAWGSGRVPVGVDTSQTEFDTVEETGGAKKHTLTTNEMPKHDHVYYDFDTFTESSPYSTGSPSQYVISKQSSQTATETEDAGGGQAHNNLQPYITCYMWKRTA